MDNQTFEQYREQAEYQGDGNASQAPISLESDPLSDRPDFPLAALPDALRLAGLEIARFDKVPVASPATIALSMIATAIGKLAIIEEREGLELYAALFFAIIAGSGERKSPPFKKLQGPFIRHVEDTMGDFERELGEVEAHNAVVKARINRLTKDAEKAETQAERLDLARQIANLRQEMRPPPRNPRRFTSDYTEQVLFRMMEAHGGEYSIQSGEGRPVFDAILGKYSGDGKTGDGIILAGISGDTITRDRIGSADTGGAEHRVILHPCLNVCVMVQPDKYLQAARHPNLRASGALARIFPVWLPSLVGSRLEEENEAGLNASALAGYNAIITKLLAKQRDTPHRVTLSPEAAEHRRQFHNQIERMMVDGGEFADVRDIASKATSQTVKLALVLHIAMDPDVLDVEESIVPLSTWRRAAALGFYFLNQAIASQRFADEDLNMEPARRILKWMKAESTKGVEVFSFATILQKSPRPRPNAKELESIMGVLFDHRQVIKLDSNGKRSDYRLNGGTDAN